MTVLIEKEKLLFVSTPKIACTSIKEALFEVENRFKFQNFHANGILRHIHDPAIYPAIKFERIPQDRAAPCLKLTIVRDPVKRFLSAFSNRVVHYGELSQRYIGDAAKEEGVPVNPDIEEFIDHLEVYRRISRSIRLHTDPIIDFLGDDPGYYDHVFDMSEIKAFDATVSEHIGRHFETPHLQTGGPKIKSDVLSEKRLEKVRAFYARDSEIYGKFLG
ncbi:sulfotransferase family 2 domain-containing protein [Fluviibacterium sp. DFM31]|uniref:Sulfotransferase family 2 domain-containing protein n=1 Tax=Meridianimarinicoccus marinus TaxID=3231483 RepID=A0ABV3L999_9RHOB